MPVPTGIEVGPKCFDLTYPSGLNMVEYSFLGVTVNVPDFSNPFEYSELPCFLRLSHFPTGLKVYSLQLKYPMVQNGLEGGSC